MPTMQAEAMGRLDAMLGRSPLEIFKEASGAAPEEPALWLDREHDAATPRPLSRHKGPDKGPNRPATGAEEPDPSVDRA
jgi:hypothetical protein